MPSAREQELFALRQRIEQGISASNIGTTLVEVVEHLRRLQSEIERLQAEKMGKDAPDDGGTSKVHKAESIDL